jgi:hypothetical protein
MQISTSKMFVPSTFVTLGDGVAGRDARMLTEDMGDSGKSEQRHKRFSPQSRVGNGVHGRTLEARPLD